MSHRVELDAAKLHDDLLARKPEGARHDATLCPFCVDNARATATASTQEQQVQDPVPAIPPADGRTGASTTDPTRDTEGGTPTPMTDETKTMSQETHEALLAKAVADATKATDAALQTKVAELTTANENVATLTSENEKLKGDNARLNGELDTAQVAQKKAEDEAAQLKKDVADRDTAAERAELRQKRIDQARNLNIWSDDQINEKADRWSDLAQEVWDDKVAEWQALRPNTGGEGHTEAASAMTGSSGTFTRDTTNTDSASRKDRGAARRVALGLVEAN